MRKLYLAGLSTFGALLASTAANAAVITSTFTGDFTGTLDGADFSTPAVFTGIGDTDTISASGLTKYVNLSSLSALAGGATYSISTTTQFYLTGGNYAGLFFGSAGDGGGAFSATGPGLVGYNAVSSLATTPFSDYFTGPVAFQTDKRTVKLSSFSNGTFGTDVAAAVPEPATWAMMMVGFGAVGFAMRRRQKVVTKVSFAR